MANNGGTESVIALYISSMFNGLKLNKSGKVYSLANSLTVTILLKKGCNNIDLRGFGTVGNGSSG